jgi:16S rRNA (cytosine1402-N4)-methyltransferase
MSFGHISVLLAEVVAALAPRDGEVHVDGTFGAGGYSRALLDAASGCRVWGIDRDPDAVARGGEMAKTYGGRLTVLQGRYGDMDRLLDAAGVAAVDGVALDIGVSSMQIDDADRGFSFLRDGPLDMRMEQSGPSAADAVNTLPEAELADILWRYGEERHSRRIARAIVAARQEKPFERTGELAELLRRVVPRSKDGIDQATRSFQGLRIYVNDELGELRRGLEAAERLLAPGGRLAVVTFHSLEDREVKSFLKDRSGTGPNPSRHAPVSAQGGPQPTFTLLSRRAVGPTEAEAATNPRARSAKLRAAVRTAHPAWAKNKGDAR